MHHGRYSQLRSYKASAKALLAGASTLPDPLASEEDWIRWQHLDIHELSPRERWVERHRVRLRLMFDPNPHPWFYERIRALGGVRYHGH